MQWSKPDFQEITLNMEVSAYVLTDGKERNAEVTGANPEPIVRESVVDG